ncbi:MAG: alpha-L-rhamnosidase N-terminal domain-containing protein [Terricaulis sp.]
MPTAPFIWTSKQAIDPDGFFAAIRGVGPRTDGLNRWFLFRRRFDLDFDPDAAAIKITCDGKYQLFVNGARLGRGPVRCSPLHQRYDAYEGLTCFRRGANTVGVLVHTYGIDTAFYESVYGHWRSTFGDGALWLEGKVSGRGVSANVSTDGEWRALECDAWRRDTPQVNTGLGFVEDFDARRFPEDWLDAAFDDGAWDCVQVLIAGGGGPEARFGGAVTRPFPILKPSLMPRQAEEIVAPVRLVWAREAEIVDLPIAQQAYEEPLGPASPERFALCAPILAGGADIATEEGRGAVLLFDFGEIQAGRPRIEIDAKGGEEFDIVVSERLPGEYEAGGIAADARIERKPFLGLDAHVARYVARSGVQTFETFEWDAVRWLQLTVRNASAGVRVKNISVVTTRFPAVRRGHFECSDPTLTRLWSLGARTIELCTHDGWIDCPSREQRQWLGDATVEHLAGEAAFGADIHVLNRHFLLSAAESQRTDGLLEMFAPGDHRRFGWLIPDFTLQWLFNVADHFDYSGDRALLREVFPTILKALGWFESLQGEDGRIADLPYWHFQDWAAVGRTGYATVLNAELLGAFAIVARLARELEWTQEAARLEAKVTSLKRALESHWDEQRGLYVDSVNPATGLREARCSQHANAAMILWGQLGHERTKGIAAQIGDRAKLRLTPAPPVTMSGDPFDLTTDIVLANTFFSHFVYAALAKAERFDLALALMRERFGAMLAAGATSLWEGFEPHTSLAHGFSSTPTWQLSRYVLGVAPCAPGFAQARIAPYLGDLEFARGVHPTRLGDVAVAMQRAGACIDIEISLPGAMEGVLDPPPGYRLVGDTRLHPGSNRRQMQEIGPQLSEGERDASK